MVKRFLLAAMAVLMVAGQAVGGEAPGDAERQARLNRLDTTKYGRSVKAWVSHVTKGERFATLLRQECGKNATGLQSFDAVAQIEYNKTLSERFNQQYPGSQIVCNGDATYGMFNARGDEYYFVNGRFVRWENKTGQNGLRGELAADNLIFRMTDPNGNYVVIRFDEQNPSASGFIDAKLPISMNANGAVMNDSKGVAISTNELVAALNRFYRTETLDTDQMHEIGVCMLTMPGARKALIDMMVKK